MITHKVPPTVKRLSRLPVVGGAIDRGYRRRWRKRFMQHWESVNKEAIDLFQKSPPSLSAVQQRVVNDLKTFGIAFANIEELLLPREAHLWPELQMMVNSWLARPESSKPQAKTGWKDYLIRHYGTGAQIPAHCSLLQMGVSETILNVANTYLGLWSKLNYVDVWNTIAEPPGSNGPTASQRWHRDPEDIRLCKIFLYHSEVDDGAGPLHYLPKCRPGEKYGDLWPQQLPAGAVVADAEFAQRAPREEWEICRGGPGTIVFADTVGFHMGGRATLKNRVFSHWTFTTPGSHWPRTSIFNPDVVQSFASATAKWAMTSGRKPAAAGDY